MRKHRALLLKSLSSSLVSGSSACSCVDHGDFLQRFTLPSLRVLCLAGTHSMISDITILVLRSACVLIMLSIHIKSGEISRIISEDMDLLFRTIPTLECFVANFEVPHPLLSAIQKQETLPQLCKTDLAGFEDFNSWLDSLERQGNPLPTNINRAAIFCRTMAEIAKREYIGKAIGCFYMDQKFHVDEDFYVGQENEEF